MARHSQESLAQAEQPLAGYCELLLMSCREQRNISGSKILQIGSSELRLSECLMADLFEVDKLGNIVVPMS